MLLLDVLLTFNKLNGKKNYIRFGKEGKISNNDMWNFDIKKKKTGNRKKLTTEFEG